MLVFGDHVGDDGPRRRADEAHADAGQKADGEERFQRVHGKVQADASYIHDKAAEKHLAAAEKRDEVAGDETPRQTAEDDDARRQARHVRRRVEAADGIGGADHENQVVGDHREQIDQRHYVEIAVEDGGVVRAPADPCCFFHVVALSGLPVYRKGGVPERTSRKAAGASTPESLAFSESLRMQHYVFENGLSIRREGGDILI